MKFPKDEHMRGRHLLDTNTGEIWPWTQTLSKKEGFKLIEETSPVPKERTGPILKLTKVDPIQIPEDVTIAEAVGMHSEHGKPKKGK